MMPGVLARARRTHGTVPVGLGGSKILREGLMMSGKGYFVSDLHLLAQRSIAGRHMDAIRAAARRAEVFVFGGDVFDFRWAVGMPIDEAIDWAGRWLRDLAGSAPECRFHYLLGNHDCHEEFVEHLVAVDRDVPNLAWDHDFYRYGSKVFLHGDVVGKGIRTVEELVHHRNHPARHQPMSLWRSRLYDATIATGLPRAMPYFVHPTRVVAAKIHRYLERIGHGPQVGVTDVYFGHLHRVLSDYRYRGLRFHSGGATVRGQRFRIVEFNATATRG